VEQNALARGGTAHATQEAPQCMTSASAKHCVPQRWNPELQVKSQAPLIHVAVARVGTEHGVQDVPQLLVFVFDEH
jgi:hypothetical protein